jgi:hypothetical protein
LVQEHLAWLDRQIAEAGGDTPAAPWPTTSAANSPATSPSGTSAKPPAGATAVVAAALKAKAATANTSSEPPEVAAAANAILEEYRVPPEALKTDIRKGCFLYFAGALAVVAIAVAVLWYAFRH